MGGPSSPIGQYSFAAMFSDLDDLDPILTDLDSMRRGGILQM